MTRDASLQNRSGCDLVRCQDEAQIRRHWSTETFAALRLSIDSDRWYIGVTTSMAVAGTQSVNRAAAPAGGWINPVQRSRETDSTLSRSAQPARAWRRGKPRVVRTGRTIFEKPQCFRIRRACGDVARHLP